MADSNPHDETVEPQRERLTRPDAEADPPPDHIGRYRVEKALGQGGFGVVYLARDEQLDRLVAIKVPHARLISKPEDTQAYLSEARTVAHLDHPHIVPVYDVGSTESCLVLRRVQVRRRHRLGDPAQDAAAQLHRSGGAGGHRGGSLALRPQTGAGASRREAG